MTIESVEVFVVQFQVEPLRAVSIAPIPTHDFCYVKLTDSDGIAGWGETYLIPGIASTIRDLAEVVLGRDARSARRLHRDVWLSSEHTWAASALSIAIDDLRGRELGVPVHQLYGGAVRDRVRAYGASTGYIEGRDPEETWPEETAEHAARGFTATKYRIGKFAVKREVPILERIAADHPSMTLMADGNGAYTIAQSIEVGRALHALDFRWLEEPMPQRGGYASYEKVAAALDISLAGGEITQSRWAALDLIARGGVDIIQPEPVIIGGIGETIFVGELARLHNLGCVPHTSGSIIGIAAALHAIATIPDQSTAPSTDEPFLEVGTDPNPWRDGLPVGDPLALDADGCVAIPTGPGLGIEIDEAFLRANASYTELIPR
ncbi:MAG: mandelate racemase/muconate lactonizing enzyme family protein [Chloroflexota bacterium]